MGFLVGVVLVQVLSQPMKVIAQSYGDLARRCCGQQVQRLGDLHVERGNGFVLASEVVERGLEFGEVGSEPGEDTVLAGVVGVVGVVGVQRAAEGEAVPLEFVGRLGELPVAGQEGVDCCQRVVELFPEAGVDLLQLRGCRADPRRRVRATTWIRREMFCW